MLSRQTSNAFFKLNTIEIIPLITNRPDEVHRTH